MTLPFVQALIAAALAMVCVAGLAATLFVDGRRAEIISEIMDAAPVGRRQARPRSNQSSTEVFAAFFVSRFGLVRWLRLEGARARLIKAGRRSEHAISSYAMSKFALPLCLAAVAALYVFWLRVVDLEMPWPALIVMGAAVLGFLLPDHRLTAAIRKRQESILRAWPDALDLLVTLVEASTTPEHALQRVAGEIDSRSAALAEELTITLTELNYLDQRRAFENLAARTDLDEVRMVCVALIQADDQGTPVASALRTAAEQTRVKRLHAAEKRGGAIASMMSMPTVIFFIAPIVVLLLAPSVIEYMKSH